MSLLTVVIIAILVVIDQLTKYLAYTFLKPIRQLHIIENVFSLTYVENRGAAFGIFQGGRWFFIIATIIVLICLIFYNRNLPKEKPYVYVRISIILIVAGAIGNFIDRLFLGYVIDFLHITFINFPVFNIADIYIVLGTFLYSVLLLFFIKD